MTSWAYASRRRRPTGSAVAISSSPRPRPGSAPPWPGTAFGQDRRRPGRARAGRRQERRRAPRRPHRRRRAGPRAHGIVPAHPRHPHRRRLRHLVLQPPVRPRLPHASTARIADRLRGLPRAAGQGEGPDGGHRRHPRLDARRARQRLPRARASTSTAKRRCPTRSTRPGPWSRPPRRTGKLLQIGHQRRSNPRYIHAIDRLIRERKAPRPGQPGLRPVEPVQGRHARLAQELRHRPGQAPGNYGYNSMDRVPQLALVQEVRRRPDRRPRLAPDRPLLLGLRLEPQIGRGQRRRRLLQEPRVVRQRHGHLRVRDAGGHGPGLLPGPDDDQERRLLRDLHGRRTARSSFRGPPARQLGHARSPRPRVGFAGQGRPPPVRGRAHPEDRRPRTSTSTSG